MCLSPHRDGDSSKNDFKPGFQFDQYGIHLKDLVLALSQTISSPQNEETRSQRFVKSRQVPLKKSTFGDLGSSIDLVNRIEAELDIVEGVYPGQVFFFQKCILGRNGSNDPAKLKSESGFVK